MGAVFRGEGPEKPRCYVPPSPREGGRGMGLPTVPPNLIVNESLAGVTLGVNHDRQVQGQNDPRYRQELL